MLVGILQTQTRLLKGIAQDGALSQNIKGGGQSGVLGNRVVVTLEQF